MILTLGAFAQGETVTGTITASDGSVLPGANVIEKGTTNGVVADFDGNYSITLQGSSGTLVFSYIGFSALERRVDGQTNIDVTLKEDAQNLDEVVVVGYGSQKKTDITGSVSSVDSEDLEKAIFNNVDQLLQGRSAGVQVTSSSGEPGAPASIRIRGNNSISGSNAPLFVVDGIPITGTPDFNPQEIESLEVLKDASATAIYGSRGANGVILVTTKRGKSGKTEISFTQNNTFSNVIQTYDVLNGQDYAEFRNEANADLGRPEPFENPSQFAGQGFNWQDEILRTGIRSDYGLSISGGAENIKYFVSANLLDDKGIVLGSKFKRGSLRANMDISALNDDLTIKVSINGTQSQNFRAITATRGFPASAGPIFNALTSEPIVPDLRFSGFTGEGNQFYNPYLEVTEKDDRQFSTNLLASTEATLKLNDNLSYTFNGGINYTFNNRDIYTPSNVGAGINVNGLANTSNGRGFDYIVSNYLTYKKIFNDIHDFTGTAGFEYSEFNDYGSSGSVNDFAIEILGFDNIGIGTGDANVGSNRTQSILQSGFFRLNYSYKNKYLLTATMRADGSSRFAANEKWGYFPSAAIGWRISEENFLKDNNTLSNFKLRASLGETGSQSIAPYQSLARYGTAVYGIGNTASLSFIPQSVANPNLKWETTRQLDIGADIGFFNNRLEFIFDYFKKETIDLLQSIQIPSQSGFGGALVNFGSIENKGIELAINAYPIQSANFSWSTGINYTSYKTKVIELGGDEEIFGPGLGQNVFGNGHIYRPGDEYGLFYGLRAIGLIQESDFDAEGNATFPVRNNDTRLGHWKFEDISGPEGVPDGIINNEDRTVIGNPNPDFLFGWNNDFTYKNLSLNVFIQGSIGNDVYNTIGTVISSGFNNNEAYKNQSVDWYENRWTPENPTNDIRYPSINSNSPPVANYMVEDASYIRLKNISLRYNVPTEDLFFSNIQFFLTGTNLLTITDYTGFDPEVSSLGANTLSPGVDLGTYPRQKAYTLGINLKF
ncbi:SusC/RagA family TonB-linked outer membrane protein [Aggregatimonas sangjinii]|nr:TonB-dependent receptor [Aggregatimonas sangjinii]